MSTARWARHPLGTVLLDAKLGALRWLSVREWCQLEWVVRDASRGSGHASGNAAKHDVHWIYDEPGARIRLLCIHEHRLLSAPGG